MSDETNTTTVDSEYSDEAIIAFQGRSGSLSNPPQLGDSRRYVIAGTCVKVSDELQDNGDTKTVCTIKARNVYEIGVQKPDDGAGLFREPCPHCGHAETPGDVVDGEFTDEDGSDEPAAITTPQLAIESGSSDDDVVDAEVVEDPDYDEGDYPEPTGLADDEEGSEDTSGLESDNDGYEPSGMDEFVAQADDEGQVADDAEVEEMAAENEAADQEPGPDGVESDEEREAREERNRKARERYAARKQREREQREQGDDPEGDE
ncbi:hypothetical protein SEA_CRACKLEWINK_65 [Mycobacterium phage Cracklewink]|uniref:Uncharacterized protein n=1 Tax=Mycobacterium phage Bipper TaxID=1805457 RepID=A0A142F2J4_9CAUD|nr:hypothetical protein KCH39_gp111 [Mycobacterium phage Bipper]AMQ67001.1 hypothetical protein SEA_BIPPER_66 [Mycobacterium phage Bipper]QDF19351.1 hypothetical protein SEA_CRACKLEWINK_65 [Mycobacterium phage Cracklewink]